MFSRRVRHRLAVVIFRSLLLCALPLTSLRAQTSGDYCQDPVDQPFMKCLGEVAKYTSWMVVPGKDPNPGELQQAIDGIYKTLQEEWSGPIRSRTHVKWMYLLIPIVLLAYIGMVAFVGHRFPPLLQSSGPHWKAEKLAIIVGAIAFSVVLLGERVWSFERMSAAYDVIPRITTRLLHLRPPSELVRATGNPCEVVYSNGDVDLMLGFCGEEWAHNARVALSDLIHSTFTKQSLLQGSAAIGQACSNVPRVPDWWDSPSADLSERLMKRSCQIHTGQNNSAVTVENLSGLSGDLRKWLVGPYTGSPTLKLEDAFTVQTAGGGRSVYQAKVQKLIGPDGYRDYKAQFLATSWPWIAVGITLLLAMAVFLYEARRQELVVGSKQWGLIRRRGITAALVIGALATCIALWTVTLG